MGNSRSLFRLFLVFSNINTILTQQINVTNDPSSMQHWDSNSQPLWHESPSLTTRPGLPPQLTFLKACCFIFLLVSRLKTSVWFVPRAASPAASVGKFKNFFVRGRKNGQRLFIHFWKKNFQKLFCSGLVRAASRTHSFLQKFQRRSCWLKIRHSANYVNCLSLEMENLFK